LPSLLLLQLLLLLPTRRQVVLLGDGFDTRPFRLTWPPGTLLFSVAPAEAHEQAEAHLAAAQPPAHVQRGCLLRRVNMNLKPAVAAAASAAADAAAAKIGSSSSSSDGEVLVQQGSTATVFREQLSRAGFRADRLSVWVLQGLHDQGIDVEVLRQLLAELADSAAFHRCVSLCGRFLQGNVVGVQLLIASTTHLL
jgi:hypothetical protein